MERKPIRLSKSLVLLLLRHLSEPSTPATEAIISVVILIVTSATASVLPFLPHEYIEGTRVPTLFFKGLPSTFQGFIIFLVSAFSASFSALFIHKRPKIARCLGYYSLVSMTSAILLLLYAASSSSSSSLSPTGRAAQ